MEKLYSIPNDNTSDMEQDPLMKDIRGKLELENFSDDEINSIYEDLKAFSAICFTAFERLKQKSI